MLTLLQPSLLHRHSRRKGQALILAVLVMLFAVLLSSAFLVVIGNSGRQVTRETERSEASRNADKGVAFAVAQLRAAPNPDAWDPSNNGANLPANAAEQELYYTQLDKAMSWDAQKFVKYPSPLTSRQAPQFMVSSEVVGKNDNSGGDKRFMLRVTVIGLSSRNPEAWSRRTLYKTTNWNGGTFSYANFVTAFDPDTQKSIASTLANSDTVLVNAFPALGSDWSIPVYASKGEGNERVTYSPRVAEVGNTLMVSDGLHQPVVGVVKTSTLANSIYTVTLRVLQAGTAAGLPTGTPAEFALNAKVALVGSLFELPAQIDENGDTNGVPATSEGPTKEQGVVGVSTTANLSTAPFGNGAQFNNGLNIPTTTTFLGRLPVAPAAGEPVAGQNVLSSSGPISIGDPFPTPIGTPLAINYTNATNTAQTITITQATSQATPSENQFFRVGFDDVGAAQVITANSAVAPVIAPRTVKPAPINLAFYRTRASASGLYLNNSDDIEKFNGQPLTTNQLHRLWQRKSFPVASGGNVTPVTLAAGTTGARLCYGRPGVDAYIYPMASGGLEARGIRGWVSPWEFLPRGAQVILNGTTITVIQDPISDNSSNAPDLNKAFDTTTRTFTTTFTPTEASVICAEGNIRVRGTWTAPVGQPSFPLTIVSGNNIYIEGSIDTRVGGVGASVSGKVALLAKKNVVLNPTQFVSRPAGVVDTSVGKNPFTAQVQGGEIKEVTGKTFTAATFKNGDKVSIFKRGAKSDGWHLITGFDDGTTPTTIKFTPPLDTTIYPDGTDVKIKLVCDPTIVLLNAANKANGTGPNDIPVTEHFIAGSDAKEANIAELDPTTNAASTGTSYAYKFAVGGDTLVRTVPFADKSGVASAVGVALSQAAQKSVVKFTVRGGDDTDINNSVPANEDDGSRQLSLRPSLPNKIDLTAKPKPGAIKGQETTFDLQDLDQDGSPDTTGDTAITLDALNTFFVTRAADADREKSRWRIQDVRDGASALTPTGLITTRRLAQGDMTFTVPANTKQANGEESPNEPTKFRVPLTSSMVLFSRSLALGNVAPEDATPIFQVGSAFGFRATAINPATDENPNTVKTPFYGMLPLWEAPADTTVDNSVTYTSKSVAGDFAFTRDGSGDYDDQLPNYYLSALHFQSLKGSTNSSVALGQTGDPTEKTNRTVEVDATIYAEGGSWFVIPAPAPFSVATDTTLNADQKIEWRRPAYAVTVNGNIAQMMTPTATVDYDDEPDADGVATGAMKRWTDSLAYQVSDGTTTKWQTIRYQAAPLSAIDTTTTTGYANLPQLPASSDILYTYSN